LTKNWIKYRIKDFNIDDICEDPTADKTLVKRLQEFFKKISFTDEQVELMLNNSKMCSWPEKFKSKRLLERNKEKFKELIGKRLYDK
jgi:hypothetical protein